MFGLDRCAAELTGLVTSKENDPTRSFRISFKHKLLNSKRSAYCEQLTFCSFPAPISQTSSHCVASFSLCVTRIDVKPLSACSSCLLYTSDAADERSSVDLGGR